MKIEKMGTLKYYELTTNEGIVISFDEYRVNELFLILELDKKIIARIPFDGETKKEFLNKIEELKSMSVEMSVV